MSKKKSAPRPSGVRHAIRYLIADRHPELDYGTVTALISAFTVQHADVCFKDHEQRGMWMIDDIHLLRLNEFLSNSNAISYAKGVTTGQRMAGGRKRKQCITLKVANETLVFDADGLQQFVGDLVTMNENLDRKSEELTSNLLSAQAAMRKARERIVQYRDDEALYKERIAKLETDLVFERQNVTNAVYQMRSRGLKLRLRINGRGYYRIPAPSEMQINSLAIKVRHEEVRA